LKSELDAVREAAARTKQNPVEPQPPRSDPPAPSPGHRSTASFTSTDLPDQTGQDLGNAVVRGELGAFERIVVLAKSESESYRLNGAGLDDQQKGKLNYQTFEPVRASFRVIEKAALQGNANAVDAVVRAIEIPQVTGFALPLLGKLAGVGNEPALDILVNYKKNKLHLSSVVGALKPAADAGNQRAIDALAEVVRNPDHKALHYMATSGLEKAAIMGNSTALDSIIEISSVTNASVRRVVVQALQGAAANQNAKAIAALRAMGEL
jgi:TPR repeat protein